MESKSEKENGNPGWANLMAKALNVKRPHKTKSIVLSKAKNSTKPENEEKGTYNFEIEGETKSEIIITTESSIATESKTPKNKKLSIRQLPSLKDFEKEKALKKIATKGVVQLFNAIRAQQKDLDTQIKDAGALDHKKDAVLENINKRKFLDVLMRGERNKSENLNTKNSDEDDSDDDLSTTTKRSGEWNVLSDDYMTNKRLKNWDQEESDDSADSVDDE